jgi:hypothetical protein
VYIDVNMYRQSFRRLVVPHARVGVIGLGDISDVFINNLKNSPDIVEVAAVAARSREEQCTTTDHAVIRDLPAVGR